MPKVDQEHLDARRKQIVDAARARFTAHGFAGTSMADLVDAGRLYARVPIPEAEQFDRQILERVLDGLRSLKS